MIELNEKWAIEVGPREHDFILVERKVGKTRDGDDKITESRTFHPSYEAIATKLMKRECMNAMEAAQNLNQLIDAVKQAEAEITKTIRGR